jgi:outer membrane protein, heavy metal efflux system
LGDNIPGIQAYCCYGASAGCEPRLPSPEQITSTFESRPIDNPKLKKVLEADLNHKFFNWPASAWDISLLTLAALCYHHELDVAKAKQISSKTK